MSPPSLIGDLAAVFLARTWHHREGDPMIQPGCYIDSYGDLIEAMRWTPADAYAAGVCIGWLRGARVNFHHDDGAETLVLRGVNGRRDSTVRPGDWIARRQRVLEIFEYGVFPDAAFTATHTPDERTTR